MQRIGSAVVRMTSCVLDNLLSNAGKYSPGEAPIFVLGLRPTGVPPGP